MPNAENILMENGSQIASAAVTDRGLSQKRPQNEDAFLDMPACGIFAVADGVGGAQAGEVASQMAMELLSEAFANLNAGSDPETAMKDAFGQANSSIYQMAQDLPQLSNMATTVVALHLNEDIATIGHVGDSRLYRLDPDGELFRETDDHSMVGEEVRAGRMTEEQAANHPSRNIISRALGAEPVVEADLKTIMIRPGTAFMLCSDGITRHVSDAEIKGVLTFGGSPRDVCDYLRDLCFERGAEDNLTAVVVRIPSDAAASSPENGSVLQLDAETATVASSRFDTTDDAPDDLLELDTAELPSPPMAAFDREEPVSSGLIGAEPEFGETVETPASTSDFEDTREILPASANIDEVRSSRPGGWLAPLAMLIVGAIIGLGVYHYALVPQPQPALSPPLTGMSSPNIPLTSFENNRRLVDGDPKGYLLNSPEPQDCEDAYLHGRAYLLTGEYEKARASFVKARELLSGADAANAQILASDIAIGISVTSDSTIRGMLKTEMEAAARVASNSNSQPVSTPQPR